MNVYDFDGTIYHGESVFDFYLFSIGKKFRLIRYLPIVLRSLVRYKRCKITRDELDELCRRYASAYIREVDDPDGWVQEFWDKNEHKIKKWYRVNQKEDDVVISASFDILLKEICKRLSIRHYLSSVIDPKTGEVGALCFRENKCSMWKEAYPDTVIDAFYSDSPLDSPMMDLAKSAYVVKKEKITKVK